MRRMPSMLLSWRRRDFMVKVIKKVMLKELMLVSLKEGNMEYSRMGSYLGFAVTWQKLLYKCSDGKQSKKIKALESLIKMIQEFPCDNPTYEKLHEDLEKIRGRFKQVCSLLHIPSDFRFCAEGSALTF
ncbi:protein LTO1 homolog isoform X4 [Hemicordylus capensis]|uniref:protein LTO1 homolog isoform X4 n=1 Tax=Hemicordylus capensis TaxID=884348 RepID=UPI0023044E09|nr:protein LTO1 homolog isoform X4 [Hemicordylus capensis]